MSCVLDKSKSRKGGFSTKIINFIMPPLFVECGRALSVAHVRPVGSNYRLGGGGGGHTLQVGGVTHNFF